MQIEVRDLIRKALKGKALLNYEANPGFISFTLLSKTGLNKAVTTLKEAGYNAVKIENFIKINL